MTVPVQNPFNSYNANGVTTQFRYEFLIKDASDLSVTLDGAVVDKSKYTLTNIGQSNGGNVSFTTAPAAGLLILRRAVIPQRLTDYQDNGPLRAEDINRDLDRLVMMIQDKQADADTALKHPLGQNGTTVPFTYDLANGRIINAADPVDDGDLVNRGYVDQLFTDQAAAAIKQAEDARDAAIVARNAAQASQQAAASSQTAASGSQTAAKTSETNAATSAQQAAASASAAAGSLSTASAAAGTATGAATTATQAASGATQQATQASASATTAGQQATAAAGSASAAAGSASSAASAMTAAQSAQQAAETARDSIINIAPGNYMLKTNNLSDLANRAAAWLNVRPEGATSLAADATADGDAPRWKQVKNFIAAVRTVLASWSVVNVDDAAPANGTTVKGGKVRSEYRVAGAEYAAAELQASVETSLAGARTVSAEVVVEDRTGGSLVSKTLKLGTVDALTGGSVNGRLRVTNSPQSAPFTSDGSNTWQETPGVFRNIIAQGEHSSTQWGLIDYLTNNNTGKAFVRLIPFASPTEFSIFQIDHTGEATARIFSPTCDERIKYGIRRIEDPLAVMRKIKGVTFRYIDTDIFGIGFTAQDVEAAFPEAVSNGEDLTLKDGTKVLGVKRPDTYGVAAALHHEAILKLMDKIEALEAKVAEL